MLNFFADQYVYEPANRNKHRPNSLGYVCHKQTYYADGTSKELTKSHFVKARKSLTVIKIPVF